MLRSSAEEIVDLLRSTRGKKFIVRWMHGCASIDNNGEAAVCWASDGRAEDKSVRVRHPEGISLFLGPFGVEQMPGSDRILKIECSVAVFARDPESGPPARS